MREKGEKEIKYDKTGVAMIWAQVEYWVDLNLPNYNIKYIYICIYVQYMYIMGVYSIWVVYTTCSLARDCSIIL